MSLDYDVVVAGAGVAGVAAALETARAGLRTALVEKTVLVGGLATAGLINHYLPLCDGQGHQVTFGIAEELLHLSLKYGPGDVPATWREGKGERYRARFSPASFVLALDEALLDAGVKLWLDTLACQPGRPSLLQLVRLGASDSGAGAPPGAEKMPGTDAAQVTRFVLEGRRMLREHYQAQQAQGGDCSRYHLFPVTLPAMAQFRTTRRIVGRETLSEGRNRRLRSHVGRPGRRLARARSSFRANTGVRGCSGCPIRPIRTRGIPRWQYLGDPLRRADPPGRGGPGRRRPVHLVGGGCLGSHARDPRRRPDRPGGGHRSPVGRAARHDARPVERPERPAGIETPCDALPY